MTSNKTYKFILFQLAVLIFVSASGFAINVHYCGEDMQNFSLWGEAEACNGTEKLDKQLEIDSCMLSQKSSQEEIQPEKCCSNKTYKIENNSDKKETEKGVNTNKTQLIATYLAVHNLVDLIIGEASIIYSHYSPPALIKKRNLVFECFLI